MAIEGVDLAIYKTPAQAEKLGKTITSSVDVSESQARIIRDYYKDINDGAGKMFTDFVTVMVFLVTKNIPSALQVTASIAANRFTANLYKSYYGQLADKFDTITNDEPKKCNLTYKYAQHGSNDGAYWLKDIKLA